MPKDNIPEPKAKAKTAEIVKCGIDPIYFMKRYVYISHQKKGLIKFDTYDFQDACVKDFEEYRFNIVLKSRQLGLSTVCAAYCLWMALFQKEKNILVMATKFEVSKNFLRKVVTMYENLPNWLVLPEETGQSVKHLSFSNGSRIAAIPTGEDAGRSESVALLIADESAHILNFDEIWMGLYSTTSTGGKIILLSTPNGVGNVFHKIWMECDQEKKQNDFHGIKLPWNVHPEHDQAWFTEQCRNLDTRGINQELLCQFLGSGHTYLNEVALNYLHELICEPIARMGQDLNIWVWKMPILGHRYIITADVARGDAEDFSTCYVVDTETDEFVAEYQGKIPPDRFAELLADLGRKYLDAIICPENNSFGLATAYRLRDLKYPNLYYEKFAKAGIHQKPSEEEVKNEMPGITTTSKNRQPMLVKLEEMIRNRRIRIYSSRFNEEAKTFIWNTNVQGGKAQAMKGYNDDLFSAAALACYIYDAQEVEIDNSALNQAMLAAWGKNVTHINTGGFNSISNEQNNAPMRFQRTSSGGTFAKGYFQKPMTAENMPPGVDPNQVRKTANVYNEYSWLFEGDSSKKPSSK